MILISNASIVNEGEIYKGSVVIDGDKISHIFRESPSEEIVRRCNQVIDASGKYLLPGVIDDQVHFRDPGLTHKGDIFTESRAAIAGGVTSFMDMPNTKPNATSMDVLELKFENAAKKSAANYSFFLGATNENFKELSRIDTKHICGIKVFMGSSTGNMLVDDKKTLQQIFAETDALVATHCEKEEIIRRNLEHYKNIFGDKEIPMQYHPLIRSEEACYRSSADAVELADNYGTRLHILHISTGKELTLFDSKATIDKKITSEVCVHHLWFSDRDYEKMGSLIKWNPAIKTLADRDALREGLLNGRLDVVATDHAPHLLSEKEGGCTTAASGGPLVQHSLQAMLEMSKEGVFTIPQVVNKMSHSAAILFRIKDRGFIRKGYYADLVLVDPNSPYTVKKENLLYKCGWSPFEGKTFANTIDTTFVNGKIVFSNGEVSENAQGSALEFNPH